LIENKNMRSYLNVKYQDIYINRLVESIVLTLKNADTRIPIYDKNVGVNRDIDDMINNIDKMLDE
jgi:hypothetical protein